MPFYDCSLSLYLKQKSEKVLVEERIEMLTKIISAVQFIQAQGYCHLDIKPSNVLLNIRQTKWNKEDIVLTDFGLATKFTKPSKATRTKAISSSGTPGFGSPEQFIGKVYEKTDNFSLGKLIVMILCRWETAWNLLAQPISPDSTAQPIPQNFQRIISFLLQVYTRYFYWCQSINYSGISKLNVYFSDRLPKTNAFRQFGVKYSCTEKSSTVFVAPQALSQSNCNCKRAHPGFG